MGLLSNLFGGTNKKTGDDVLLLAGMIAMCAIDGDFQEEEQISVANFVSTLPEFRGKDIRALMRQAAQQLKSAGSAAGLMSKLAAIESPAVRSKLFVLAADLAMSSGDIDEAEEKLLADMQKALQMDDAIAKKVVEVLALKYAV
jgi:uncharacterized tellurite resistance protein B-like protein